MLAVPLVIAPIAFVGGLFLAARFTGERGGRLVDLLAGAAAVALALNVYLAVRAATSDIYEDFGRAEAVAGALTDACWQGGLLAAAAAVVHLLARPRT